MAKRRHRFSVAPEKGIFYCFGCHKGGGVVNFIMEIENLTYGDAVRFLAKRAGLEVPDDGAYQSQYKKKERLWALCRAAAQFYHAQLKTPAGEEARAYLQKRGVSGQTSHASASAIRRIAGRLCSTS